MTVRAGRLRQRIQLLKSSGDRDKFGAKSEKTEIVGTYWCEPRDVSNEVVGSDVRQNQHVIEFETRYNKRLGAVDSNMFINYKGVEYDILNVNNPRLLNERLIIRCMSRG